MKTIYRKTIELGKADYNETGRKNCPVTIDIELRETVGEFTDIHHKKHNKILELSICGNIWNPRKTDIYTGGQCLDTILDYFPYSKKVSRIAEIWERWHLNALKAGCTHQKQGDYSNHEIAQQVCPHTGYKYGTSWLYEEIPEDVIEEIKQF